MVIGTEIMPGRSYKMNRSISSHMVRWSDRHLGFRHKALVDGGRSPPALAHGQDHRGPARDDVSSGVDPRDGRFASFVVNHNNPALQGLQPLVGHGDQR